MAEYYALLARAVGALPRNDEGSRREIYVKARSALIRQLKAITPPLPAAEISKQRLALEEAIRRVEREAAEAAVVIMLSDEEISRQAERALERALAPGGEDDADHPSEFGGDALRRPLRQPPPVQAPTFEPVADKPDRPAPSFDPGSEQPSQAPAYEPYPQPSESPDGPTRRPPRQATSPEQSFQPRQAPPTTQPRQHAGQAPGEQAFRPGQGQPSEQPRSAHTFEPQSPGAEVMTPPSPGRRETPGEEGYAEVVRPRPAERVSPRGPGWERATAVTDIEEPSAPRRQPPPPLARDLRKEKRSDAKRGGRGWERVGRTHGGRSIFGLVAGFASFVIVVGAGGYFLWDYYGDDITVFFGGEVVSDGADVVAAVDGEGDPDGLGAGVEVEEPPVFIETVGFLYLEPSDGGAISDRYEASIYWSLLTDDDAISVIAAAIEIPDQGITIDVRIEESTDPQFSHEISALLTQATRFQDDPIDTIDNISVKTSEEGIGAAFAGDIVTDDRFFLLALPSSNGILNTNRIMQSPWFDLAIIYQSGRRVIVSFNKGTAGDEIFSAAYDIWQ